jgi:hypothetical protein
MPEPSDPLSVRLAIAPGLATLLDEARATWLARAERDTEPPLAERDVGPARAVRDVDAAGAELNADATGGVDPAVGSDELAEAATTRPTGDAPDRPSVRVRPSTPRWRAFEDAFPTFYQFTNRPRG